MGGAEKNKSWQFKIRIEFPNLVSTYDSYFFLFIKPTMANIKAIIFSGVARNMTNRILSQNSSSKVNLFDLNFDRRIKVDYKESINYMESEAFKKTYGGELVWKLYRRNHKNTQPSKNTRPNCINKDGFLDTSYPCPVCRDEYLVIHPENTKLLNQFIDPYTDKVLTTRDHGLCQKQYRNLIIAVHRARDLGYLTYDIPDRLYDYEEYDSSQ